ncbi:MAG: glycerophosphodiester phosphodiesterase [Sphingobacteriales bacterium]|jgi:glycerophosphoryl diester phosphodiesterase
MYDKHRLSLWLILFLMSCSSSKHMQKLPEFDKQGHRGARGLMPENTIPAMIRAIDLGVTTLEMDVVISKDNQVVVSHDPYFNSSISTKPDGSFLKGGEEKSFVLYQMNYAEIQKWDVGKKLHPIFSKQEKIPAVKPLLSVLIDSVEAYLSKQKNSKVWYNIETKSSPSGDGKFNPDPATFVDLLMGVIKSKHIENRTVIQSFDMRTLQVLHEKYPKMVTSFLLEASKASDLEGNLKNLGFTPSIYSPEYRTVTAEMIKVCHDKGMRIIPWTINDAAEIRRLRAMGVDGIISDYPDLFDR